MLHALIEKLPERHQTKAHFAAAAVDSLGAIASTGLAAVGYYSLPPSDSPGNTVGKLALVFFGATALKWGEAAYQHIRAGRSVSNQNAPAAGLR
jgi:hypothetical protein